MSKRPKRFYIIMATLLGIYVALTLAIKPSQAVLARFGLSTNEAYAIILSLDALFAIIWMMAVYGFVRVLEYSQLIARTKDGQAFQQIALGLGIIAFRSPITSILTNITNALSEQYPNTRSVGVIIVNYIGVFVAVMGFWLISLGTDRLVELVHKKTNPYVRMTFRILSLILITAYTYLAIGRGGYQQPLLADGRANFYLPSWLIVSTIIVPYAYAWYLAFVSSYNLLLYSRNIKGIVYRRALHWIAWGINIIIINTIIFQFLSAQGSRVSKFDLAPLLGVVYILLISIAIGFSVVAVGAKKLKKIEEV